MPRRIILLWQTASKVKKVAWYSTNAEGSSSFYLSTRLLPHLNLDTEWVFNEEVEVDADISIYQIENLKSAEFVKEKAKKNPGIIIYHDYLDPSSDPLFDIELANSATHAIFTQERSADEFRRLTNNSIKISYLPYPVQIVDKQQVIKKKIAFTGGPENEWRSVKLLDALLELDEKISLIWLIDKSEIKAVKKMIEDYSSLDIRLLTNKSVTAWENLVQDCEVAVHTLYSAILDHGPYLPISLASSAKVILTNFGAAEFVPDQVCHKISAGANEVDEILGAIKSWESKSDVAREWISENHDPRFVAAELRRVLQM